MRARRMAILLLMLAGTAVAQSALGTHLAILTARPDLVLLLVVTVSVSRGAEEGLLAGLLGGMMVDTLSAIPFGTATVGMALAGLATGLGESNLYRANYLIPLAAVFLATVAYHSFLLLALQAAGWSVEWISTLALQTIPGAILNALLAPLALPVVRRALFAGESEEGVRW